MNKKTIIEKKKILKDTKMYSEADVKKMLETNIQNTLRKVNERIQDYLQKNDFWLDKIKTQDGYDLYVTETLETLMFDHFKKTKESRQYFRMKADLMMFPKWLKSVIRFVTTVDIDKDLK